MPAKQSRSAERRYRRMLRESLGAGSAETGVAAAASSAIGALSMVAGCQDRGEAVSHERLARFSTSVAPVAAARVAHDSGAWGRWALTIVAALAACLFAAVLVPRWTRHASTVSGTILVDRNPIAGIDVVFHNVAKDGEVRVTTGSLGEFRVQGIERGDYTVSLHAEESDRVPPAYRSPDSSPFRLHVEKDLDNLQFFAISRPTAASHP